MEREEHLTSKTEGKRSQWLLGTSSRKQMMLMSFQVHSQGLHVVGLKAVLVGVFALQKSSETTH